MEITKDIINVGVNDKEVTLFEGQYKVYNGMSYNSYVILDEKIAVLDTVGTEYGDEWLNNIERTLGGREPNYLIIEHMEPDHSANIVNFLKKYKNVIVVCHPFSKTMINNFFDIDFEFKTIDVKDGDTLSLGKHTLKFIYATMVHWPEVMMVYDEYDKVLFSADAFGKFGTNDIKEDWIDEARRYYIGIVGKFGTNVKKVLDNVSKFEIEKICSLHGPALSGNISYYIDKYSKWASYEKEEEGVLIVVTSIYGHTKKVAELLQDKIKSNGYDNVKILELKNEDLYKCVACAFRYGKLILATTTYYSGIFPSMKFFIENLLERNYQNRKIGFIENGSWAPTAMKEMRKMFENSQGITFFENNITINSAFKMNKMDLVENMAKEAVIV